MLTTGRRQGATMMSRPTPDPTRWLTDLMSTQHVLWPDLRHRRDVQGDVRRHGAVDEGGRRHHGAADGRPAAADGPVDGAACRAPRRPREPIKDRRFAGEAWTKDPRYEAVARTYLAQTDLLRKALDAAPLDERSKAQWGFALRQVIDALSPANTLATNPEALQLAMETGGASLVEGMRLFTEDLAQGRISMTDETAFEVGRNVGTTPGTVVFQNELIQLIQYTPTTAKVYKRPLVIIPPCINKYYILDLQPANSFVAHAVAEGHTVFLVVLAQRRPRAGQPDLGRLPRAGRAAGDRRGHGDHARPTRSTRWASASAARCWPARWRSARPAASTRRPA